jgi:Fe-Mn family superoxide dismutase
MPIDELLGRIDEVPQDIRQNVINNGGGYANHKLFWTVLSPDGGGEPTGSLADAINDEFGSFDDFKQEFKSTATGQFGSGWGWLCVKDDGSLTIISTANQDSPYMQGLTPILGLDVWEHAYYLKYQNKRGDYADAFWNLVNWDQVNEYYEEAE